MQRDPSAYLNDIIKAAAAIKVAIDGLNGETYGQSRLIRSAVEREFIIIGEALKVISRRWPALFASIPECRQIIDFRNLLNHEYLNVSDCLVWGAIQVDLPTLNAHCRGLLQELNPG
jgi:uncharacterized protein with HEPN domain